MLKKTFSLLSKNPTLIIYYILFVFVSASISTGVMVVGFTNVNSNNLQAMASKTLAYWMIFIVISIIFMSGYGNLLAKIVNNDKGSYKDFFKGINKFIARMVGAFLLVFLLAMGLMIIISLISIPIGLILASQGAISEGMASIIMVLVIGGIILFIYPLFMLWFPAIFIDDKGVIESLRHGAAVGKKNYWTLILTTIIQSVPSVIFAIYDFMVNSANEAAPLNLSSPEYWANIIISTVVSYVIVVFSFVIYKNKSGKTEIQIDNIDEDSLQ